MKYHQNYLPKATLLTHYHPLECNPSLRLCASCKTSLTNARKSTICISFLSSKKSSILKVDSTNFHLNQKSSFNKPTNLFKTLITTKGIKKFKKQSKILTFHCSSSQTRLIHSKKSGIFTLRTGALTIVSKKKWARLPKN